MVADKQYQRAFQQAFRIHLTTRPQSQVVGVIRESPLATPEEFVKETFEVSTVRFCRDRARRTHPLVATRVRLTMPLCDMRRPSTLWSGIWRV